MKHQAEYNKLYNNIKSILGRGAQRDWSLGSAIIDMRKSGLWKGAPHKFIKGGRYKTFNAYMQGEFMISHTEVVRCARIAASFTKKQVKGWSSRDINMLANVRGAELREKLMRTHPEGCSRQVSGGRVTFEEAIRKLPNKEFFHKLKRGIQSKAQTPTLVDVSRFMLEHLGTALRIEIYRNRFRVSITSKSGILAVGMDESASTATRNAIASFKKIQENAKSKAA